MFEVLADEVNTRVIANVSAIVAVVGIVIPFLLAVVQYRADRKLAARDAVLTTLETWGTRDNANERFEATEILKKYNSDDLTLGEILDDPVMSSKVISFLDTNEYLALYTLVDGDIGMRVDISKRMQRGAILRYWNSSNSFVRELRKHTENPKLYREFERLAKVFSE